MWRLRILICGSVRHLWQEQHTLGLVSLMPHLRLVLSFPSWHTLPKNVAHYVSLIKCCLCLVPHNFNLFFSGICRIRLKSYATVELFLFCSTAEITWASLQGQGQSLCMVLAVKLPRVPPLQPSEGKLCELDGQKKRKKYDYSMTIKK